MASNVSPGAAQAHEPGFDRGAAVTRSLLGYGVLVGPFYLAVGLIQAALRQGFDIKRHPLSVLANGPGAGSRRRTSCSAASWSSPRR